MSLDAIKNTIDGFNTKLAEKGWRNPKCTYEYDGSEWFWVRADHPIEGGSGLHEIVTIADEARTIIGELPDEADAARDDFRKALGRLIDKGNKLGIDTEFLNPLTEQMRALSENIITAR